LASIGWMGPVVGALVHNLGSVLVVLNSALILKYEG
ncbi:MAG TPA: cation-transporting P-type ATPase, partial [Bacillota bacterium]|nr:cation-transporting P-type ATPase [Bacillota bacterium]